jgi:Tfp pilus assembly protein PilV
MRKHGIKKGLKGEAGFTLVEILVAIGILVFGLLAVGTMQISAIRGNFFSGNTSMALALAGEKMEHLMNQSWDNADLNDTTAANNSNLSSITTVDHQEGVTENGQVVGAGSGLYRRIWNIANSSGTMPNSKAMTVIVTWEGNKHRVSVSSLRIP